jgi:hypothetical protein
MLFWMLLITAVLYTSFRDAKQAILRGYSYQMNEKAYKEG